MRERYASSFPYFVLSYLFSFWIVYIPEIKKRLDLTHSELGLALFFISLGSILSMLTCARFSNYLGEGKTCSSAMVIYGLAMFLPIISSNYYALCLSLFILGYVMCIVDISMNSITGIIEQRTNMSIMSFNHAMFSIGGVVGSMINGFLLGMNWSSPMLTLTIGVFLSICLFLEFKKQFWKVRSVGKDPVPKIVIPHRSVFGLALIAFCVMLCEGAVADWSAIYLGEQFDLVSENSGVGYAIFSLAMVIGRLAGAKLSRKFSRTSIVRVSSLISCFGLLIMIVANGNASLLSFVIIGLGLSNIIPIVFSDAASRNNITSAYGIASVAGLGYIGFLVGPVMIGFLSDIVGLRIALSALFVISALVFFLCSRAFCRNSYNF